MNVMKFAMPILLAAFAAVAYADNSPNSQINGASGGDAVMTPFELALKNKVEKNLREGVKVDSVHKSNYAGLYEVHASGDVFYTDDHAKYLFFGSVVDAETKRDYTHARIDEINKINFSDLPLDSAIKMVKGNGKRVVAVFEDPNCGYCKKLRESFAAMDNVTVYTFMYNILDPESSPAISRNVWCTPDRLKAWDDWMLHGKRPEEATASCATNPNDKVHELGQKLRIGATPTIFFADGTRTPGFLEPAALEQKWATIR